jgi:subtilisin-like proprotein convertase family protein
MTNGVVSTGFPRPYSPIVAGGSAVTQYFTFTAIGVCGGTINPILQLQDGSAFYGALGCSFPLGAQTIGAMISTNPTTILIPGTNTIGPALPYPSSILVSGVVGTVSSVTVTLLGLAHQYPADIDLLLVGPTGTNVLLMSNCGGGNEITNVILTFDDAAATYLPDSGQITSGSYIPTGHGSIYENFAPPAPVGPYGEVLAAFSGLNPNGVWSLYAQDVSVQDVGSIAQGWQLNINASNTICCSGAPPPPPLIQSIVLSNGMATMTWSAMTGETYRLQYTTNLTGSTWTTVSPDVTATNFTVTRSSALFSVTQCFYRVLIVP